MMFSKKGNKMSTEVRDMNLLFTKLDSITNIYKYICTLYSILLIAKPEKAPIIGIIKALSS